MLRWPVVGERKLVVESWTSKNTINDCLQVNNHEVERQQHKEQAQLALEQ